MEMEIGKYMVLAIVAFCALFCVLYTFHSWRRGRMAGIGWVWCAFSVSLFNALLAYSAFQLKDYWVR